VDLKISAIFPILLSFFTSTGIVGLAQKPELVVQTGHSVAVTSVAFSADNRILAAAGGSAIKLWEVATGRELRALNGHSGDVTSVAFNVDGKVLASGSNDKTIKLWDVATGRELRTLTGHSDEIVSVAFSVDGKILAAEGRKAQ